MTTKSCDECKPNLCHNCNHSNINSEKHKKHLVRRRELYQIHHSRELKRANNFYHANRKKIRDYQLERYKKDPKKYNLISKNSRKKFVPRTRDEVFSHYSSRCKCCGLDDIRFLTIDHIYGGKSKFYKKYPNYKPAYKGYELAAWLKRNNYPAGFQLLCMNCNFAKGFRGNNGLCPHNGPTVKIKHLKSLLFTDNKV